MKRKRNTKKAWRLMLSRKFPKEMRAYVFEISVRTKAMN